MPKLDGTNACLFMKDGTVHAGSRTREINMNKDNANFCKTLTLNGEKEFPQIIQYLESHPDYIVYGEWLGADGERFPGHIKNYLNHGFGYGVCEKCYEEECSRENAWRSKKSK